MTMRSDAVITDLVASINMIGELNSFCRCRPPTEAFTKRNPRTFFEQWFSETFLDFLYENFGFILNKEYTALRLNGKTGD